MLYDLAHTCGLPEGVAGWAAKRWFHMAGEQAKLKNGAPPSSDKPSACYIQSNMALITCHGDFGVSDLEQQPPSTYTAILLDKWCRKQSSIVAAWDGVSRQLLGLQERYKLPGIAYSLEICTRTWANDKKLKLHLHAWILQHKKTTNSAECVYV